MPKLSRPIVSGRVLGGTTCYCFRASLDSFFGQVIPRMGYQLLMGYFSLSAVWHLLTRWFQDKKRRENIFVTLAKLVVAALVFDSIILQDLAPSISWFLSLRATSCLRASLVL